jgi:hypothetical protein
MAAGPAGVPAVHVGLFPPRPGSPATNRWLVFALMGSLTRAIAWLLVTWQRIRTPGGVFPSTITMPPADHQQAATDPEKVLVNALRAARRVAGALIRWLVATAKACPASAVLTMFRGAVAQFSTAVWTSVRPQRIKRGPGTQNQPGAADPGARSGQNRCATWETEFPRSTNPPNREICRPPVAQQPDRRLFQGEVIKRKRLN